jgi:hypothetical protein
MNNGVYENRVGEIRTIYEKAFKRYDPQSPVPEIKIEFYPYIGVNHTIRRRNGRIYVRISQICSEMPLSAHEGLAYILVSKLYRKRVPTAAREIYSRYASSHEIREKATESKRQRGRKVITTPTGEVYDLEAMFDRLNREYFREALEKPTLTWSARKTYRILGHHDSTHNTIVLSRSLDDRSVPRFVVEYVLFHEMLHIAHPAKHVNGRRYHHTPAFRRDERKFAYYEEAESWIERSVRKLKREARLS